MDEEESHKCLQCDRKLTKEEYDTYDGMCQEFYEIEIDELDCEDGE